MDILGDDYVRSCGIRNEQAYNNRVATLDNPHPQRDEIPDELNMVSIDGRPEEEPPDDTSAELKRTPRI
jgi:hypothetical protein